MREPAPGLRDELIDMAFQRGLLLLPCGPTTIRFCPPLCLTARQVGIGLKLLSSTMDAASGHVSSTEAIAESAVHELEELAPEPM